jgi:tyrosinase
MTQTEQPALMTRYERVRAILDAAAGDSAADYGVNGRFWHLPPDQLADVEVQGVRMIASPETAPSCCAGHAAAPSEASTVPFPGRGSRSGLVIGLRGRAPFDGSRFPPLPWGGRNVADEDIRFISDWIDDGLPGDDHSVSVAVAGTLTAPVLEQLPPTDVRTFEVYEGSPNEYRYQYRELKQRMNIDCMPPGEVEKFREAFRELYRLNKWPEDRRSYNNMALIHQNHCQHGWERFLPWHRVYLYEMEQTIQDIAPGVTVPYWDWTMPHYMPSCPEKGGVIPDAYKAYLTSGSLEFLERADPSLPKDVIDALRSDMLGKAYTSPSAFFDDVAKYTDSKYTEGEHRNRFIDALLDGNALWYPLRYPAEYHDGKGKPGPLNKIIHYHYPTADDMAQIMALKTFADFGGGSLYNDSFGFLDQNPHNTMHLWTGGMNPYVPPSKAPLEADGRENRNRGVRIAGRRFHSRSDLYTQPAFGDMFSNLTASYDPVFWPIHTNIDRLWGDWQKLNPHAAPIDRDSVLTPWSYTIEDTLEMARFGYEYVKCAYLFPVGLSTPVGRFVSKAVEVPPAARNFRQAEVRLHRVPQLERSCFIRVFLNLPDANASTPLDDPHYAGYLAIFGHGPCYGGPGHCDLPPARPRPGDLRPRNHNTPRNHRVNVTKTAQKLLESATSLQITLVAIGADYCEDSELLRVDGVSLDFLD